MHEDRRAGFAAASAITPPRQAYEGGLCDGYADGFGQVRLSSPVPGYNSSRHRHLQRRTTRRPPAGILRFGVMPGPMTAVQSPAAGLSAGTAGPGR